MNNSHQPNTSMNVSASAATRGIAQIVVESCIFVVLDFSALIGNVFVCLAWYRNPSLRTITNIFILSLAFTDLLMAVLIMPLVTASSIANRRSLGDYYDIVRGYGAYFLAGVSLLTLMLLAVNRYFRVVRPACYPNIYTKKRSTIMAVCAWIVTTVVACAFFLVVGIRFRTHPGNPTVHGPSFPNGGSFVVSKVVNSVYILVPSVVIAVCYVRIFQRIRQHYAAVVPSSQERHSAYGVEDAKMTRLLSVVLIGFYLCWLPPFITSILDTFNIIGGTSIYYNFHYYFPFYASSVINPIIYATMSQPFRKEFLKICRGLYFYR